MNQFLEYCKKILAKAKNKFWLKEIPATDITEVFLYLADLIVIKHGNEPIREDISKIISLKDLAPPARESATEEIYIHFENILSKDYNMAKVQSEIRARFNLNLSKLSFVSKFLTRDERDLRELENRTEAIVTKLLPVMGRANLDKLIRDKTSVTLLNGIALTNQGSLDFSAVERRLFNLPPPWLKLGIKFLRLLIRDLSML